MSKIKPVSIPPISPIPPSDEMLREIVAKGMKRYNNSVIVEGILELEYLDAGFTDPEASILKTGLHYQVEIAYYDRGCSILNSFTV